MKTAEEILDSKTHFAGAVKDRILEAMKEYAIAMCQEQKRVCSEEAMVEYKEGDTIKSKIYIEVDGEIVSINRQSILKAKNVAE